MMCVIAITIFGVMAILAMVGYQIKRMADAAERIATVLEWNEWKP